MENSEELLDDKDFQGRLLSPINKELSGLSYWLRFSAGILVVIAVLGIFIFYNVFAQTYYYPPSFLVILLGLFISCVVSFFLVYKHTQYIGAIQAYLIGETEEELEELAKISWLDWRLSVIVFVFGAFSISYGIGTSLYDEYYRETYSTDTMEEPSPILDEEFRIEDEPVELEELEEDPAPPTD